MPPPRKVRIIGGRWRGRRLPVISQPHLRPTPDRVRETLFNWLQPLIEGAVCLDLFAGTGVLGFEALSRGAERVVLVEQDKVLVQALEASAARLGADNAGIHWADAGRWLAANKTPFDVIFVDPPFASRLLDSTCTLLAKTPHLAPAGVIYVESGRDWQTPEQFQIHKRAHAGQVHFMLLTHRDGERQ